MSEMEGGWQIGRWELGGLESEVRRVRGGLKVVRLSEVDGL